jgi:hypothetical protein
MDIEDFKKRVDWKSKDKYTVANQLVRQRVFDGMTRYLAGGLKSLGSYVARSKPMNLYQATKDMAEQVVLPFQTKQQIFIVTCSSILRESFLFLVTLNWVEPLLRDWLSADLKSAVPGTLS